MNPRTEAYLRRGGVPEDVLAAMRAGEAVLITPSALEGWLKDAWMGGLQRRRHEVEAEIAKLDRYYDRRLERAYERLERLANIERSYEEHRFLMADVVWWFNGFRARMKKHDQTPLPDRGQMLALLHALADIAPVVKEEKIPF